eukprot:14426892-Alexandrium_andersonii.AAC.1
MGALLNKLPDRSYPLEESTYIVAHPPRPAYVVFLCMELPKSSRLTLAPHFSESCAMVITWPLKCSSVFSEMTVAT